jgi:predicted O-linked N-acetylglucosamine transferase (SPINDLY family)
VDILLDMKGFTQNSRSRILGYRPAPLQVSYLGYPATMDRRLVDYLIADECVVPPGEESQYAETILRLPFCYQPNDNLRQLPQVIDRRAMRRHAGLPEDAIVLGVFQQNYKLHPALLSCWADILREVPDTVLWCLHSNADARDAMEAFFAAKGVPAKRLHWGGKVGQQDHLDRLALVDLALDSWPVNGHTSTADALWAGTPVLTRAGNTFVSRVAGSLLHAVHLPDFVTQSSEAYAGD